MAFCYSEPFESLIKKKGQAGPLLHTRFAIVGSGYGGSIAAYRLALRHNKKTVPPRDLQVAVFERGREYSLGEFPNTLGELPGHLSVQRSDRPDADGNEDALFNFHQGEGVHVLVGSGLGGTSLINANVALRPPADVFQSGGWPAQIAREAATANSALDDAFSQVTELLDVADSGLRAQLVDLPKYKAFASFAKALGCEAQTAPIAVTLPGAPEVNRSKVAQKPCTFCGNCVTGCNVGAKNTLTMNAIPRAYALGARFYTGARVIRVSPLPAGGDGPRWEVHVEPTSRVTRARCAGPFVIHADSIILSAGTLGSTEILQRSALSGAGKFSPALGERFSTNGDGVSMSFGERELVSAIGTQDYDSPHQCGPTITAMATGTVRDDDGAPETFTLEEGAVPASIARLVGELLTSAAQAGRLGDNRLPAAFQNGSGAQPDPLSVDPAVIDRSQVFLCMGADGTRGRHASRGRLQFKNEWNGPESGFTVPAWRAGTQGPSPPLERIDRLMSNHDRARGLRGGQYVPNPFWKIMPEAAASVMNGTFPGGQLITVHPLGGCPMSDSGLTGVVNHNGQVFRGATTECHAGLYVLDGSIVPTSLGVNPFLTIAALSWRASEAIAQEFAEEASTETAGRPLPEPPVPLVKRTEPQLDAIIVRERLVGRLENAAGGPLPEEQFPDWNRWLGEDGFILQIESSRDSSEDLLTAQRPVKVHAKLYTNPIDAETVKRSRMYGAPDAYLLSDRLIAEGEGTITFMRADFPSGGFDRWMRALAAFRAYLARRQSLWSIIRDQCAKRRGSRHSLRETIKAFMNVAEMHATYRDFDYDIDLEVSRAAEGTSKPRVHICGRKRIAFSVRNPRLWQSLLEITPDVWIPKFGFTARARLVVDMRFLLGSGLLSVAPGACVPAAVVACTSFIARFARCMVQASFWEFGSPEYPDKPIECRPALPARLKDGTPLLTFPFNVPKQQVGGPTLPLKLHLYGDRAHQPVLLIHGLAQGSLIYADSALETSMADYLHAQGYDVWLLDYRLSNLFTEAEVPFNGWTIDEIGRYDIPLAVAEVLSHYGAATRLHVFAHCVGAIGTTMAILSGLLDKSRLASVVLNAIHPWTIPSAANTARAKLAVFYRDLVGDDFFNPIPQAKDAVSATQSLLDRLAFSLARLGEVETAHSCDDEAGLSEAICDRMTFLYGRMWLHENVKQVHRRWKDLVGRAPGSVQRHLFYCLTQERVLDHEGLNRYLLEPNLRHWQGIRTLFIHGEESGVFNPQSATRSAFRMFRGLNSANDEGTPIRLRRVPGFGHMDVILADDAAEKSFPYVHRFFAGDFDHSLEFWREGQPALSLDSFIEHNDLDSAASTQPAAGPIMRAARVEQNQLWIRYWIERPSMNTSLAEDVELVPHPDIQEAFKDPQLGPEYEWLDVAIDLLQYGNTQVRIMSGGLRMAAPPVFAGTEPMPDSANDEIFFGTPSNPFIGSVDMPSWLRRLIARREGEVPRDCCFLVASCLYTGTPFDSELGDRIFGGMLKVLDSGIDCDLLFLLGDQIYADATSGLLDPVAWRDRYTARYRDAFNGPMFREVLNRLPCHFAVDDHEFADNYMGEVPARPRFRRYRGWQEDAAARAIVQGTIDPEQFRFAKMMARSYQSSGRDLQPFGNAPRPAGGALWYALDHESEIRCPAFVLDTRSERRRAYLYRPARLMTEAQMLALLAWLGEVQGDPRPKFIFSGSVIAPLARGADRDGMWMRQDGLAGYPDDLERIVSCVVERGIQRVVFVGGDLHLSCTAPLQLVYKQASIRALQIVSSGLYSPLPFANLDTRQVAWGQTGEILAGEATINYEPALLASERPHFVRVSAREEKEDLWIIRAEAYGEDGRAFATHEHEI